ncbi:MAG: hypothetical protein H7Z41_17295, partial [Cytophagales bacterium]|nr:hypothetical protein [Armatimonadota bacterium]
MVFVVQSGSGDIIERMWRLMVSARRNADTPEIWRLTDDILESVREFYRLGQRPKALTGAAQAGAAEDPVSRFLDIPVDPTTT